MEENDCFSILTDGVYCLQGTSDENEFYFYRIDGETLEDYCIDRIRALSFYIEHYLKVIHNNKEKKANFVQPNFEYSTDGTYIRLTIIRLDKGIYFDYNQSKYDNSLESLVLDECPTGVNNKLYRKLKPSIKN